MVDKLFRHLLYCNLIGQNVTTMVQILIHTHGEHIDIHRYRDFLVVLTSVGLTQAHPNKQVSLIKVKTLALGQHCSIHHHGSQ